MRHFRTIVALSLIVPGIIAFLGNMAGYGDMASFLPWYAADAALTVLCALIAEMLWRHGGAFVE